MGERGEHKIREGSISIRKVREETKHKVGRET
jgi:ribosomal protein L20A (L18A)